MKETKSCLLTGTTHTSRYMRRLHSFMVQTTLHHQLKFSWGNNNFNPLLTKLNWRQLIPVTVIFVLLCFVFERYKVTLQIWHSETLYNFK